MEAAARAVHAAVRLLPQVMTATTTIITAGMYLIVLFMMM